MVGLRILSSLGKSPHPSVYYGCSQEVEKYIVGKVSIEYYSIARYNQSTQYHRPQHATIMLKRMWPHDADCGKESRKLIMETVLYTKTERYLFSETLHRL